MWGGSTGGPARGHGIRLARLHAHRRALRGGSRSNAVGAHPELGLRPEVIATAGRPGSDTAGRYGGRMAHADRGAGRKVPAVVHPGRRGRPSTLRPRRNLRRGRSRCGRTPTGTARSRRPSRDSTRTSRAGSNPVTPTRKGRSPAETQEGGPSAWGSMAPTPHLPHRLSSWRPARYLCGGRTSSPRDARTSTSATASQSRAFAVRSSANAGPAPRTAPPARVDAPEHSGGDCNGVVQLFAPLLRVGAKEPNEEVGTGP